jgi:predicted nucleotidyltransferase
MRPDYTTLIDALRRAFGSRLKTAVLFGSQSRDEARPNSDHDVFVVVEGLPREPVGRQQELRSALRECLADLPGAISLVGRTPLEFESDLTPLYVDICVDGICLYGDGYFEPFRKRALAGLKASGMKRQRIGNSLYWMIMDGRARDWEWTWDGYHERTG